LIKRDASLGEQLIPGLPYLRAEAIFAVTHEMANTLDDILSRRTRSRIINRRATVANARDVAKLVAPLLGWSEQEIANQVLAFANSCSLEDEASVTV
jgi:glycerol-3-phosphate dehydrogenase